MWAQMPLCLDDSSGSVSQRICLCAQQELIWLTFIVSASMICRRRSSCSWRCASPCGKAPRCSSSSAGDAPLPAEMHRASSEIDTVAGAEELAAARSTQPPLLDPRICARAEEVCADKFCAQDAHEAVSAAEVCARGAARCRRGSRANLSRGSHRSNRNRLGRVSRGCCYRNL